MNLTLNPDALIIILDSLRWAGHDTRLPQEVRDICNKLADDLSKVPVIVDKENEDAPSELE